MNAQLEKALANSYYKKDLEHIRESLWSNTMAVLVGSGFSLNANPNMPSWSSWARVLADEMEIVDKELIKAQDVPWLAGAFAKRYSPNVMHELLIEPIHNYEAITTHAHEQLVKLPWTDIFTTNYDTFLEDAAKRAQSLGNLTRRYKVISSASKLPLSCKGYSSRIVKLHGCINTDTSWIITEEEYRTYRDKYAPFVNTVRQTILENELCLIGYSATDPDFLEWIGWVRDRITDSHLNIYWFTKNNLTEDEKCIYAQRGITCISLDCFNYPLTTYPNPIEILGSNPLKNEEFPKEDTDESLKQLGFNVEHYRTYSNFLQWLSLGNPNRNPIYIDNTTSAKGSAESGSEKSFSTVDKIESTGKGISFSQITPENCLPPTDGPLHESSEVWIYPTLDITYYHQKDLTWEEIQEQASRMEESRKRYPSWWIIPPMKTLRRLWDMHISINFLINQIEKKSANVPKLELLKPLYETCWLLDMAGLPSFNDIDKYLEETLNSIYSSLRKNSKNSSQLMVLTSMWMGIATLLLRWFRQKRDYIKFWEIEKKLSSLLRRFPSPEIKATVTHQKILYQLETFNRVEALKVVKKWDVEGVAKIWTVHKGMLLAELGSTKQGYRLLTGLYEKLLQETEWSLDTLSIARLIADRLRQFSLLSDSEFFHLTREKKEYEEIPKAFQNSLPPLRKLESDFIETLDKLQADVKSALGIAQRLPAKIKFETGTRDNTQHFYSGLKSGLREVFQCCNIMERLGTSPYVGYASFDISTWLEMSNLFFYMNKGINDQSLRILLRSAPGNTFKVEEDIFLQYNLAILPEKDIQALVELLCRGLQSILDKKTFSSLDERYTKFGLELLSRLSVRISQYEDQAKLLKLVIDWTQNGPAWNQLNALSELSLLTRRAIESSSYKLLNDYLGDLLSSPVLMGFSPLEKANHHLYFSRSRDIITALPLKNFQAKSSNNLQNIAECLWNELKEHEKSLSKLPFNSELAKEIRENTLSRYYYRILWMLQHELVPNKIYEDMAKHVWENYEDIGLPELPGMRAVAILDWPTPPEVEVIQRYKTKLHELSIPAASSFDADGHRSYSSNYVAPLSEYLAISLQHRLRLNLTKTEKLQILKQCYASEFQEGGLINWQHQYARQPLHELSWILTYIFGSSLKEYEKDATWLPKWLAELIDYGKRLNGNFKRLEVLNTLFDTSSEYRKDLAFCLEEDLYSEDSNIQTEAGYAILFWYVEIKDCPVELYQAILRGFWLLGKQQAASLCSVLGEQFDFYEQQHPVEREQLQILFRALKNKLLELDYKKSIEERYDSSKYHTNEWVTGKIDQELLPEHRFAIGLLIKSLCKHSPKLYQNEAIKQWLQAMKNDPLADMRRLGEETSYLLSHYL